MTGKVASCNQDEAPSRVCVPSGAVDVGASTAPLYAARGIIAIADSGGLRARTGQRWLPWHRRASVTAVAAAGPTTLLETG